MEFVEVDAQKLLDALVDVVTRTGVFMSIHTEEAIDDLVRAVEEDGKHTETEAEKGGPV